MMNTPIVRAGAFGFLALAASAARAPLGAQEKVQLAFGYECDDRFMIKNDGANTVTVHSAALLIVLLKLITIFGLLVIRGRDSTRCATTLITTRPVPATSIRDGSRVFPSRTTLIS